METITIDNNQLIGEVKKLLKTFPSVVLPVKGTSMLPFIIGSKESVELVRWEKDFQIGDIVLAWTKDHYVIHRIIKIDGDDYTLVKVDGEWAIVYHYGNLGGYYAILRWDSSQGKFVTTYNSNSGVTTTRTLSYDEAKAEYVVDKHGNKHYLYTSRRCQASRLWNKLKPVRRWILAIYRRTILKMI